MLRINMYVTSKHATAFMANYYRISHSLFEMYLNSFLINLLTLHFPCDQWFAVLVQAELGHNCDTIKILLLISALFISSNASDFPE